MTASLSNSANALETLLVHCHRRNYPAKSTIVYAGDKSDLLYYVIQGSISVLIEEEDGKEMIVAYLKDGDFFGELGLFDEKNSRSAWIKAKTSCEIAEISYSKFHELAALHPELLFAVEKQMARRLRTTTRKVLDLAFLDVTGRVAGTLVELCRAPGAVVHAGGIQISITRHEIALVVGCSREMVGRVLKVMEEQGLISTRGKTMVVHGVAAEQLEVGAVG